MVERLVAWIQKWPECAVRSAVRVVVSNLNQRVSECRLEQVIWNHGSRGDIGAGIPDGVR